MNRTYTHPGVLTAGVAEGVERERRAQDGERVTAAGKGPAGPGHHCPATVCKTRVAANKLMCPSHWYMVPKPLRDAVWRTWRSGAGAGTPAHTAAIDAAIKAVNARLEESR